jgi:hypothetical protein
MMGMYKGMMDAVLFVRLKRDGTAFIIPEFKQISVLRYVETG